MRPSRPVLMAASQYRSHPPQHGRRLSFTLRPVPIPAQPSPGLPLPPSSAEANLGPRLGTLKLYYEVGDAQGGGPGPGPGLGPRFGVTEINTPAMVPAARRGAVPHITRDVLLGPRMQAVQGVHLSLEDFLDVKPPAFTKAPFGLRHFIGLGDAEPEPRLISMSLRDPTSPLPLPSNGDAYVAVQTGRGSAKVTPPQFAEYVAAKPPDILFAMADEPTHPNPGGGRLKKSLDRSLDWLYELLPSVQGKTNVFATLVGSPNPILASAFATELTAQAPHVPSHPDASGPLDAAIAGYAFPLSYLRLSALASASASASVVRQAREAFSGRLDPAKPRAALGVRGPHEMLALVEEAGVDLFVDGWTSEVSTLGVALDFDFPPPPPPPLPSGSEPSDGGGAGAGKDVGINLFEDRYADQFVPLSASSLAAAASPTRGYLHHLLHSHEMAAHVFLQVHNHAVTAHFLASVRASAASGAFAADAAAFRRAYAEPTGPERERAEYGCVASAREQADKVRAERGRGRGKKEKRAEAAVGAVAGSPDAAAALESLGVTDRAAAAS